MAHDIPTGNSNTLPKRMTRLEQVFSQLMDWLGDLPVGYVLMNAKVNGNDVLAMVDTGATHSFVTGREVRWLKLELKEHGYRIKAVNAKAQPVLGVASVELTLEQ
ncbi:hypothetical protein ACH5RR_035999 [Cinchona calisaya]|uniref:Aspartyl protease n=1 Tax=Cinchona calisaya TaxID=153742 RepID=A0ABD2Y6W8_9GENT